MGRHIAVRGALGKSGMLAVRGALGKSGILAVRGALGKSGILAVRGALGKSGILAVCGALKKAGNSLSAGTIIRFVSCPTSRRTPAVEKAGQATGVLDDGERRRLVEQHMDYVRALAGQVRESLRPPVEPEDLVAYGMQGLVEAARRYDPRQGVRFTTYSYYRIRGAIFDGLRRMGWISRTAYGRAKFEERANSYLQGLSASSRGRGDVSEVARAMDDLAAIFVTSMDAMPRQIPDQRTTAQDSAELGELHDRLRKALATLPERERRIIELYYYGSQTLEEAGRTMGLSKSWASRLHAKAVERLGRALRAEDPGLPDARRVKSR